MLSRPLSHAFYILGPQWTVKCPQCRLKLTLKDSRCPQCNIEADKHLFFVAIPVFRYEDTEGKPVPEYTPKQTPPLVDVAQQWGIDVKWASTALLGKLGSYSEKRQEIVLGTEDAIDFFHELSHAGHARIEKMTPGEDPEQEIVAELSAATLARIYGYNCDSAQGYIGLFAESKTPEAVGRACYRVLGKVEKVVNLILETATPQIPA